MPEIKASTQEHLEIEDILDDLVVLRNGVVAMILETTSVNFDLLSETEQDAMIASYGQFLNSLSFPVQVLVRSKKMDISTYLESLAEVESKQANPFLKEKIKSYRHYVEELIAKNEVLDKRFYLVVAHQEITLAPPAFDPLGLLLGRASRPHFDKRDVLAKAKVQLKPKKEHVLMQTRRVGIKVRQLTTQELVELFYDIYNPEAAREQRLRIAANEYTSFFIEPAVGG